MRSGAAMLVCALALLTWTARAWGEPCAPLPGAATALQEQEPEVRLRFLSEELHDEAARVRLYDHLWRLGYAELALGQAAMATLKTGDDRKVSLVGAGSALVGVAALTLKPLAIMTDGRDLPAQLRQTAAQQGTCAALAKAEALLIADERDERECVNWLAHVGNAAFNLTIGAVVAFALHDKTTGAINAVVGTAVGEIMFATQPKNLVGTLQRYRQGRLVPAEAARIHFQSPSPGMGHAVGVGF